MVLESVGIDKLKKIILKSEEEKREHALLFCGDTDIPPFGNISHSDLCIGTKCSVSLKDCKGSNQLKQITAKGKREIGSFHTHLHQNKTIDPQIGNLSGGDIYRSISERHRFSCIGHTEDNEKHNPIIKCFVPEFDIDTASKFFTEQDDYHKKLTEYNLSDPILSMAYDKYMKADIELYQESNSLAKKLLSKEADLIIR